MAMAIAGVNTGICLLNLDGTCLFLGPDFEDVP